MMESSELGGAVNPTGLFPRPRRRPLRSQTYNMLARVLSCCDSLQASAHRRAQGEEGSLEVDSALIKESLALDEAKDTDASKDVSLLDNGGILKLGKEELMALDGGSHVENRSTLSPGRELSVGGSGNVVCDSVNNTSTSMEVIADVVRSFGIDDEMSPVNAVNFSEGVEHELQLKQRELEELIFSPQNIDLSIVDEGVEEGEISGDDGAIDFLLGDSFSLEEKKSDDLLVSEDNVENGNGKEGTFKDKRSLLLDRVEGGNDVGNLERITREESNVCAKSSRDNASLNYEHLDGRVAEQASEAKVSHHSVISAENLAQRRQITYDDIIGKTGSATYPKEVGDEIKRKRGPLTKERKAKKKRKDRIKRAEMNKQLGVKRLKLEPVVKPKKVVYCRHYMVGRCHEGEKCKFSHDTTPLTKSTPCSFLARNSCMKGDDCPFDHELSKYPCNNFVSQGFCSRGADCLFKHEASNINDPSLISKLSNIESKSQLPMGGSNSKNKDGVANQNILSHSTGKLSENQVSKIPLPRGISFLPQVRSPITNANKHEEAAPNLKLNGCVKSSSSTVSNHMDTKKEPLRPPKGINFLSFGKGPLGISKESGTVGFPAESVGQSSIGSERNVGVRQSSIGSVLAQSQEKRNAGDGLSSISTPNRSSALGSQTVNPLLNQGSGNGVGSSSSCKTPVIFNTPTSVQSGALRSTLAFAAKIDSGIRLNVPTANPFDVSRNDMSR